MPRRNNPKTGTFVDYIEEVREDVVRWGVNYVKEVVGALAPDGRGYGMKKLSEREQLYLYTSQLRGNKAAWDKWISDRIERMKGALAKSGLTEDQILAVHPYNIVEPLAVAYSSRMESLLAEYQRKQGLSQDETAPATTPRPLSSLPSNEGTLNAAAGRS